MLSHYMQCCGIILILLELPKLFLQAKKSEGMFYSLQTLRLVSVGVCFLMIIFAVIFLLTD